MRDNFRQLGSAKPLSAGTINQITPASAIISAEVDGEVVLMSLTEGCYFGLDDIASDIWRRLQNGCMLGQLLDSLLQDYDAPREVIENGVVELLRQMAARDLVVLA